MCLYIYEPVHGKSASSVLVADRPLIVQKQLSWVKPTGGYAPYYGNFKYIFGKTHSVRKFGIRTRSYVDYCGQGNFRTVREVRVYEGLHSLRLNMDSPDRGEYTKRSTEGGYHWAVIPKGAKFLFGRNNDVVSTELIVFRTKAQLLEYLGLKTLPEQSYKREDWKQYAHKERR